MTKKPAFAKYTFFVNSAKTFIQPFLWKTKLIIIFTLLAFSVVGQEDSIILQSPQIIKYPVSAAVQVVGLNMGVWGINRMAGATFANIGFKSIRRNFRTGFVWDNDQFSTNMFMHPYHGGLYYNAARMNGLSFGWSSAYALGGSLMWELFMETEPPSVNDVLATTLGGIALGEITFRLANGIIDNRKRGFNRVWREAVVTVISPAVGINRFIRGDMWKRNNLKDAYHPSDSTVSEVEITTGVAWLSPNGRLSKGSSSGFIRLKIGHGSLFKRYERPYDYFSVQADVIIRKQFSMGDVSLLGRLWSRNYNTKSGKKMVFGVFQHFDYITKDTSENSKNGVPVQISGAAVVGTGLIINQPVFGHKAILENSVYTNIVLLGGTHSDYYSVIDRNYNLGSGYSIKSFNSLHWGTKNEVRLNYHLLHLFTWQNKIDSLYYKTLDPHYLDVQGTPGNTQIHILQAGYGFHFSKRFAADIDIFFYHRESRYKDFEMVIANTIRVSLGLTYSL